MPTPKETTVPAAETTAPGKAPKRSAEDKATAFKSLAASRVGEALHTLSLIENLSGSNYVYTPEQAAKIVAALRGSVDNIESAFANKGKRAGFSL